MASSLIISGGPSFIDSLPVWTTKRPFCMHFSETLEAKSLLPNFDEFLKIREAISPSP
jgi:hypothetical protein